MNSLLKNIKNKVLREENITPAEIRALAKNSNLEELFKVANEIKEYFLGNKVDLCSIMNAKSGKCSEDCKFCAQSSFYNTGVKIYPLVSKEDALKLAKENELAGVHRFSLVTSGKGITSRDFNKIIDIYKVLKENTSLKLCASLGIISYEQGLKLKEAGVTRYHHNMETSLEFFSNICTTHTYAERIQTIKNAEKAGLEVCSGGIFGLGESMEDRINMAFELKELGIKSIPINILNPIKGTPLEKRKPLEPKEILKTIALYRFIIPKGFIRYAGGRKALGEMARLGLKAGVNGILTGNYLTTAGNTIKDDIQIIREEGLEV